MPGLPEPLGMQSVMETHLCEKCLNEAKKIVESLDGLVEVTLYMWETITVIVIITILINIVNTMRPIILHDITSKPRSFDNCVCSSQQN